MPCEFFNQTWKTFSLIFGIIIFSILLIFVLQTGPFIIYFVTVIRILAPHFSVKCWTIFLITFLSADFHFNFTKRPSFNCPSLARSFCSVPLLPFKLFAFKPWFEFSLVENDRFSLNFFFPKKTSYECWKSLSKLRGWKTFDNDWVVSLIQFLINLWIWFYKQFF